MKRGCAGENKRVAKNTPILSNAVRRSFVFKPLLKFLSDMRSKEECEWQMPKGWAVLIGKGMKDKVNEIAFLMKELRIGGMLSSVGAFSEKKDTDTGENLTYEGIMYEPLSLGHLMDKFHVEFRDNTHENYHERRKRAIKSKGKRHKIWNVDGSSAAVTGFVNTYKTISDALMAAGDGDEIRIFPKKDGNSYKERLVVDKNVVIRGMKNTFKAEVEKKDSDIKLTPKASSRRLGSQLPMGDHMDGKDEGSEEEKEEEEDAVEMKQLSTLDIVEGMAESLKKTAEEDKAFEEQKERERELRAKGKKVEKRHVVIEYHDVDEEHAVIRSCSSNVRLSNLTVKHSGPDNFAAIFVSYGNLACQQVKVYSEGGDGIYVTQGASLKCKPGCHLGPCKRNGVLVEGLCSVVDMNDSEVRGNVQCGVKVLSGGERRACKGERNKTSSVYSSFIVAYRRDSLTRCFARRSHAAHEEVQGE